MKTSELIGTALDWAVAKALDGEILRAGAFSPSTNWVQGGFIIEQKSINIIQVSAKTLGDPRYWVAEIGTHEGTSSTEHQQHDLMFQIYEEDVMCGPTPLIAAMRCFVASKLGHEVEVTT